MDRSKNVLAAAVVAVMATGAVASVALARPDAAGASCAKGTKAAVIGGKRVCLKVGFRCAQRYQPQYRRHGFECVRGRLVKSRPLQPFNPRITITGPEEMVFDWSRDRCDDNDVPDLPARVFRDADGQVQLIASHYETRRMIGPDFNNLKHDCAIVLGSSQNPDPAAHDDKQWLASVYTTDGRTVYGLVHNEYQGNTHPGRCPSGGYIRCWWNTIALVVSNDGGRSYRRQGARNGLVAAIPYRYEPDIGFEGVHTPSQIVRNPADGYYYSIVAETIIPRPGVEARYTGACLIRTRDLADPTSWRTADALGDYTRTFIDPYARGAGSPADHTCRLPIQTRPGTDGCCAPFHASLSWNTHLQRWLLVGMDQNEATPGPTKWGIYFAVSKDLSHGSWSLQRLVVEKKTAFNYTCGQAEDPIQYPSVIDHASTSRSFETTGNKAYLYYTVHHFANCQMTQDRDLVRVPITISK